MNWVSFFFFLTKSRF